VLVRMEKLKNQTETTYEIMGGDPWSYSHTRFLVLMICYKETCYSPREEFGDSDLRKQNSGIILWQYTCIYSRKIMQQGKTILHIISPMNLAKIIY
jgi:hypothetical protein